MLSHPSRLDPSSDSPQHPSIFTSRCNPSVLFDSVIPVADFPLDPAAEGQGKIGGSRFVDVYALPSNSGTVAVRYCRPLAREQPGTRIVDLIREVLCLKYLSHPCVLPLLGWNFRPDLFKSQFLFVMPKLNGSIQNATLGLTERNITIQVFAYKGRM
jgi:hypothetical protein